MKIKPGFFFSLTVGFLTASLFFTTTSRAQTANDTIRVMVYNTLTFGAGSCQTPVNSDMPPMYTYLRNIVQFANADIIGLDKMQCVKTSVSDVNGLSSPYFPDTILSESLNAAYPGRYSWCPFTDLSRCLAGNSELVFFDHNKLTYVSTTPMYYGQEDFDMFKLYYNSPYMTNATDTTYLYIILCHTISSTTNDTGRDGEDSCVMLNIRKMFTHTPNLIYMGDFNTRESDEPGYAYITQTTDTNFILYDPPFYPDAHLTYPDIWHSGNTDQAYFTTTTRSTTLPNSCGTTGGAKDWYDHILLSPWIVNGVENIKYVRNSYKTIGNDGARAGISVNSGTNNSAPSDVLSALFNFSDKYPVEVTLAVSPLLSVKNIQSDPGSIKVNNPVENGLVIHFASFLNGQNVAMAIYDVCGRCLYQTTINVVNSTLTENVTLSQGVYFIRFASGGFSTTRKVVKQ